MHIESVALTNFRCFGPAPTLISLSSGLTTFIGANGAGKTAMMHALQRMFGVTNDQRRIKRQDFHIPANETLPATQRTFVLEAMIAFPELDNDGDTGSAIPEFFHHMAADHEGKLKCRLRLEATWSEDGSVDGNIEQKYWAIRTFGPFTETDCVEIKAADRTRIQMIYVPASRDGSSQVSAFLRGRLWRAISWSEQVRSTFSTTGQTLNSAFSSEAAVGVVAASVTRRWQEVHSAGTDTTPMFRPIDLRFQEFIRKVEVVFRPDESGRERALEDLSDGQRSLFHLAMTAATLDVEGGIAANPTAAGFQPGGVALPSLTLIAVEEPENNLAPFYLSQIVRQIEDLTKGVRAQAIVSSHSPSILSRVDPTQVRHFRLEAHDRTARINSITLPLSDEAASKFIREAVRAYPELYFARFVVLGEGASEEVVLPRLAEALKLDIDRSFVAVVPLGGRHVNHLWKLLTGLKIPHATLLDLDWGRDGGGWGRIKTACTQLLANATPAEAIFGQHLNPAGPHMNLAAFDSRAKEDLKGLMEWVRWLRQFNVFFCAPLDLDYSMLKAMPTAYRALEPGRHGPSDAGNVREAVFGEGDPKLYPADHDDDLKWYRYLFLGRGKPSTHVRVLGSEELETIAASVPEELSALLKSISARLSQKVS